MSNMHRTQPIRRRLILAASAASAGVATLSTWPLAVRAQAPWPQRTVKLVVPFPPGGPVDAVARILAARLSELWGQQVLVDNRPGAGGQVGADLAAKATDGHTLFACSIHHTVLPALKGRLPYDIQKDFVPLSFGARFPVVLVTHPSVEAKTVAELIALAKKQPGKLSYASSGNGGGTHLAGELFAIQSGTQLVHVPYKGSAPAMSDVLGGQVPLMFSDAPTALPQWKAGKVRALGVANAKPSVLFPGVPAIAESGLPSYEAYSWTGYVAPASLPRDAASRAAADIQRVLAEPAIAQRLHDAGAEAAPNSPEAFGRFIADELAKWTRVVKTANIQAD